MTRQKIFSCRHSFGQAQENGYKRFTRRCILRRRTSPLGDECDDCQQSRLQIEHFERRIP
jgi:hypothetical protein